MGKRGIVVAYAGVHNAYLNAEAADQIAQLDRFYCSVMDAPGLWGPRLSATIGASLYEGRRPCTTDLSRIVEVPLPLMLKVLLNRVFAHGFTADVYRSRIKALLTGLLNDRAVVETSEMPAS